MLKYRLEEISDKNQVNSEIIFSIESLRNTNQTEEMFINIFLVLRVNPHIDLLCH